MLRQSIRTGMTQVGLALREPEQFAARWETDAPYGLAVWIGLGTTAILGTSLYGITMGLGGGLAAIGTKSLLLSVAAGLAWAIPLPALYILHSLGGSRLRASSTLLAALVTTSWGGLALIASVPINWFFSVAVPAQAPDLLSPTIARAIVMAINLLVFAGVGLSMSDVFRRVMLALETDRPSPPLWFLGLVGAIGAQLFYLFGIFTF